MNNVSPTIRSVDVETLRELENGARVHSVFNSTMNIEVKSTLLTCGYDLSPGKNRLVLDTPFDFKSEIPQNTHVRVTGNTLVIGHRIFNIRKGAFRESRPYQGVESPSLPETFANRIGALVKKKLQTIQEPTTGLISSRFTDFLEAPAEHKIDRLIGAGIGLTPLGDDMLMGYCLAEKALHGEVEYGGYIREVLERTNRISAQQIQDVLDGHLTEFLTILLDDLLERHNEESTRTMLEFGASSGAGIMLALIETLKRRLIK